MFFHKIKVFKKVKEAIWIIMFFMLPTASTGVRFAGFGSVSKHSG